MKNIHSRLKDARILVESWQPAIHLMFNVLVGYSVHTCPGEALGALGVEQGIFSEGKLISWPATEFLK
jgi:hypothetical protein